MQKQRSRPRGSIVARGNRKWLVRLSLGINAQGKRVRLNRVVHGSKADAARVLTSLQKQADDGLHPALTRQSLDAWLHEWLETYCGRLSERTRRDYQDLIRRYLPPELAGKRLAAVTAADVQRLLNTLSHRGLSGRTVRYLHATLRTALNRAVKVGKISRNVATLVDLPRMHRREMKALTPAEARRLLAAAEGTPLEALWAVLLTGWLRPSEALALRWTDLDGDTLRVQRTLLRPRGGGWTLAEPKTPKARRVVVLPATAVRALGQHRRRQAEARLRLGTEYRDQGFIFASPIGDPLDLPNLSVRQFKPLLRSAGLPDMRLYDLRHSAATLILAMGTHPKVVAERLDHASVTLTLDTYSHVLPEMQTAAATHLETLLFGSEPRSARLGE